MIHCIGNSHCNLFSGHEKGFFENSSNLPGFKTYPIGPVIAYNFKTSHMPLVLDICKNIPKGDKIILCVGEVDARWHLPLQAHKQNRLAKDIVAECMDRFFPCLLELKNLGYYPIGWGTHPTTINGHDDNENHPVFGECSYRNLICQYWNAHLASYCALHDIPYYSIYDKLVDENNITKMEYFQDYCHLNSKAVPLMLTELESELNK